MWFCPECDKVQPDTVLTCGNCGAQRPMWSEEDQAQEEEAQRLKEERYFFADPTARNALKVEVEDASEYLEEDER